MLKLVIFSINYAFKDYLFKHWFIIAVISVITINIYSATMPFIAGIGFQRLPESKTSSELAISIMLTAGLFVLFALLQNIEGHIRFRFHIYATQVSTLDLISGIQNNSLYNINKYSSGELIHKIKRLGRGVPLYLEGVIMGIIPLFTRILVMFFMLAFTINITISVVFIIFFFYILVVAFLSSNFVKIIATKFNKIDDEEGRLIGLNIDRSLYYKIENIQHIIHKKIATKINEFTKLKNYSGLQLRFIIFLQELVVLLPLSIAMYFVFSIYKSELNHGNLLTVGFCFYQLMSTSTDLLARIQSIKKDEVVVEEIKEVLDNASLVGSSQNFDSLENESLLKVQKLNPENCLLNNGAGIHFTFNNKDILVIKGKSGIGKTSIFESILGMKNYSGTVAFSKKLAHLPTHQIFAYVPQFPMLLGETIRECLTIGLENTPSDDELRQILSDVGFRKTSDEEDVLERQVVDAAEIISGGEIQKIAILHALFRRPKLMLLDEPTSAMDKVSSESMIQLIPNYCESFIVISHDNKWDKVATQHLHVS